MSWNSALKLIPLSSAVLALSAVSPLAAEAWPDLPVGIKSGISVQIADTAYVGLGSAGTDFYSLDLANPAAGWVKRAAFVGPATNGAAAAAANGKIYVFSGNGKPSADAKSPIIFDTVYAYDTESDSWSKLDTQTPAGLSGAKALPLSDGRIAIVGGYNKELFDRYLADVMAIDKEKDPDGFKKLVNAYMGMEPKDYRWNAKVLSYTPATNSWGSLGDNPFLPNCDSAIIAQGSDTFTVISGEIKPGLRTPAVKSVSVAGERADWQQLADLPAPAGDDRQEGVAGAYAAEVSGVLLVAGGANFKGAQANAEAGRWFAHEGLKKDWREEVYAFDGGAWKEIGKLPRGLAYGASFTTADGLLVAGGEDDDGKPRTEVFLIRSDGAGIVVED